MDFFTKILSSSAKSLATSQLKNSAKDLINRFRAKSPETLEKEVLGRLGYNTGHYSVSKDQKVNFKPSSIFMNEWLLNSPGTKDKLIKDEETGQVYFDNKILTSSGKVSLINTFVKATEIKSPALNSHLEAALKLLDTSDYVSGQFREYFAGWEPNKASIIDQFIPNIFKGILVTDADYATSLFRKWIVGTAKRAIEPGSALDGCLTLTSVAGTGKTSLFRNLLPEPFSSGVIRISVPPVF